MNKIYFFFNWGEYKWFISVSRSGIASTTTSEAEVVGLLCNRSPRDMTERCWSTNKRVLSSPSHSLPGVRWACHQGMTNKLPALSLHYFSGTSWTRTNPSKMLVWIKKKYIVGRSHHLNKGATLENSFSNTRVRYWIWRTKCTRSLFSVPCLKWPWVIGDVVVTIWIGIQPK
jgi:hypothetical protein